MEEELDEVARGEREWVPLLRAFYGPLRELRRREAQGAQAPRLHDRGDRRGLLGGAPDGHPAGPQRAFLACSSYPEHKETAAAARRGAAAEARGRRRALPAVRRGRPGDQARPVRAVRRLLALPGLHVHQEGRPAAARPAPVRGALPEERRRATSSRVARGGPGTSSGGAPTTRSATSRRTHEPLGAGPRRHDDGGPVARKGETGLCLTCGARGRAAGRADLVGLRLPGGPPDPAALANAGPRSAGGGARPRTGGTARRRRGRGRRGRRVRELGADRRETGSRAGTATA